MTIVLNPFLMLKNIPIKLSAKKLEDCFRFIALFFLYPP